MVIWPSGKAEDCKSFILQFESGYHLMQKKNIYINNMKFNNSICGPLCTFYFFFFMLYYFQIKKKKNTYIYLYVILNNNITT